MRTVAAKSIAERASERDCVCVRLCLDPCIRLCLDPCIPQSTSLRWVPLECLEATVAFNREYPLVPPRHPSGP